MHTAVGIITPILQNKKLSLREVKQFIKNDIAKTWPNQNLDQIYANSLDFPEFSWLVSETSVFLSANPLRP